MRISELKKYSYFTVCCCEFCVSSCLNLANGDKGLTAVPATVRVVTKNYIKFINILYVIVAQIELLIKHPTSTPPHHKISTKKKGECERDMNRYINFAKVKFFSRKLYFIFNILFLQHTKSDNFYRRRGPKNQLVCSSSSTENLYDK